jgi:hypothetical protein
VSNRARTRRKRILFIEDQKQALRQCACSWSPFPAQRRRDRAPSRSTRYIIGDALTKDGKRVHIQQNYFNYIPEVLEGT